MIKLFMMLLFVINMVMLGQIICLRMEMSTVIDKLNILNEEALRKKG